MYTVYKHTCPNGKVYIGITSQKPQRRWGNGNGYKENEYFYRAILKYGWDNIKHEIVAEGLTEEEATEMEIDLICMYRSTDRSCGYNRHAGGKVHDTYSLDDLLNGSFKDYDIVEQSEVLTAVFNSMIKAALGSKHKETVIRKHFSDNVVVFVEKTERDVVQKPSYFAICFLLEHYGETEKVKAIKPRLLALKQEIENDI